MKPTLVTAFAVLTVCQAFAVNLGSFNFDAAKMGDTLAESDGGAHSSANWLNTTSADPGNPGYLTGANFETGIANIGPNIYYTIGYNSAITDGLGDDFGIVVARYSEDNVAIRIYDGASWTNTFQIAYGTATSTGENRTYYYGGGGPYASELFVHSLDLSSFGISQMTAIEVGVGDGSGQLDLIRVGGFEPVPEPGTMAALGLGLAALARRRRK